MKSPQPTLSVAASLLALGFLGTAPQKARAQVTARQNAAAPQELGQGSHQASRESLQAGLARAALALQAAQHDLTALRMTAELERSATMTRKALADVHTALHDIRTASLREPAPAASGHAAPTAATSQGGAAQGGQSRASNDRASNDRASQAQHSKTATTQATPDATSDRTAQTASASGTSGGTSQQAAGASTTPSTQVASNTSATPSSTNPPSTPAPAAASQAPAAQNGSSTNGGQPTNPQASAAPAISPESADNFIGKDVVNQDGQTLGELKRVITGPNDHVQKAVLEYGGFLGLFTTQAEIDWKQASPQVQDGKLVFDMTPQQVDDAPRYAAK